MEAAEGPRPRETRSAPRALVRADARAGGCPPPPRRAPAGGQPEFRPPHTRTEAGEPPLTTAPVELERPETEEHVRPDLPWVTIVWNDPINLMSYVTYVFQAVFGYSKRKAHALMLDVHHKGRAVVSSGTREEMERDVSILHEYGLWATLQQDT
ncbi:ATP-dependent Clp protease adapter ClpS [Streptomonospora sp. NEAU-YY374]|nr:ATP-dependent Clp protease adapter ClpS [Streptomonospora nanhaiensis]